MKEARSIYKGGDFICASDKKLNSSSCIELGLRCIYCGEPVFFRSGNIRCSHFAHFSDISSRKLEICTERQKAYSNASKSGWRGLVLGKGQRLELFHQYFLSIIASKDSDFYKRVEAVKAEFDCEELKEIREKCNQWFWLEQKLKFDLCYEDLEDKYFNYPLQMQIVYEALDYLPKKSSTSLLEDIICYSIFRCCKSSFLDCNELKKLKNECSNICHDLIKNVVTTNWIEVFSRIECTGKTWEVKRTNHSNLDNESASYKFEDTDSDTDLTQQTQNNPVWKSPANEAVEFAQKSLESKIFTLHDCDGLVHKYALFLLPNQDIELRELKSIYNPQKKGFSSEESTFIYIVTLCKYAGTPILSLPISITQLKLKPYPQALHWYKKLFKNIKRFLIGEPLKNLQHFQHSASPDSEATASSISLYDPIKQIIAHRNFATKHCPYCGIKVVVSGLGSHIKRKHKKIVKKKMPLKTCHVCNQKVRKTG